MWDFLVYVLAINIAILLLENLNCSIFVRNVGTVSTFCWFMCYVPLGVNALIECQFVSYVLCIKHRYKLINQKLLSLTENNDSCANDSFIIYFLRKMHLQLYWAGNRINKAFSIQILATITSSFVCFATHTYFCFTSLTEMYFNEQHVPDLYDIFTSFLWTFSKLVQIFIVCFVCENTIIEVIKKTIFNIFSNKILCYCSQRQHHVVFSKFHV